VNARRRPLAPPNLQHSQGGGQLLRPAIARRLSRPQTLDGWGFDVELLYLAQPWGYRITEVAINRYYAPSSRISPLRDSWTMTRDVLAVRRNARAGRYDSPSPPPSGGDAAPSAEPTTVAGASNGRAPSPTTIPPE